MSYLHADSVCQALYWPRLATTSERLLTRRKRKLHDDNTTFRSYTELRCLIPFLLQTAVVIGLHSSNNKPTNQFLYNDSGTVRRNY